jgi:regulator of protease activity HflC (stomatin/prohibitin superfamily)
MAPFIVPILLVAFLFVLMLMRSIKQVNQWETALKFTLGKFSGKLEPGLNVVWPIFQSMQKIDTRVRNRDLPRQMAITKDNVTVSVDAVVYFKVVDPEKAILNVENYELAVKDRAKVVLRDLVGETDLDVLLAHRDQIAAKVRVAVEQFVAQWGLHVELVALQDIQLPPQMQEVIARKAIAERDRQYVVIKSQADVESARNFAEAARILVDAPGAMELRRLEALQNITSVGSSKVIFDLAKPYDELRSAAAAASALTETTTQQPATQQQQPRIQAPPVQKAFGSPTREQQAELEAVQAEIQAAQELQARNRR